MTQVPSDARRVVVRGTSGSGKTTLARAIASTLGVTHVELDAYYHQKGWTPLSDVEFARRVRVVAAEDGWVVCGNYRQIAPIIFERVDTVVLYDLPRWLVMRRVLRRSLRRTLKSEELWNGNKERWRNLASFDPKVSVVAWAWSTHRDRHRQVVEMLNSPPRDDLRIVHVTSARDERRVYEGLAETGIVAHRSDDVHDEAR